MSANFVRKLRLVRLNEHGLFWAENLLQYFPNSIQLMEDLVMLRYYNKDYRGSYDAAQRVLDIKPRSSEPLDRAVYNKKILLQKYEEEEWFPRKEFPEVLPSCKLVTLTITTGKRLPLLIRTLESFFRNLVDPWLISRFVCIDDNSSENDRHDMRSRYPFFEFYNKTEEEKGHAKSMKMLTEHIVKTPYMLHLEDDWLFINRIRIADMIEILTSENTTGQVVINKNYTELPSRQVIGGIEKYTNSNLRYYIHDHSTTPEEQTKFNKRHGFGGNSSYWPHFSLQPSLIKMVVFKHLQFSECVPHFEMEFAYRYRDAGWKTAFLQEISCKHIGRLISERNDPTKLNAYDLLGMSQFGVNKSLSCVYITNSNIDHDLSINAVISPRVQSPIESHCNAWKMIIDDSKDNSVDNIVGNSKDGYVIMDDHETRAIEMTDDFLIRLKKVISVANGSNIILLSCHHRRPEEAKTGVEAYTDVLDLSLSFFKGGAACCYYVTKSGAKALLKTRNLSMHYSVSDILFASVQHTAFSIVTPPLAKLTEKESKT